MRALKWNPISPLRERMIDDMQLHRFSQRTQQSYVRSMEGLTRYFMRSPDRLSEEEIRKYFVHLTCERKLARPTVTIALCGIKFFYEKTLKRDWSLTGVPTPKREKKVPVVLRHEQVKAILGRVRTVRHRACLSLIYACGLRLHEACQVRVTDIDRVRGLLRVNGKGTKQRYVPLPESILPLLEACWRNHRNPTWLFPLVGRGGRGRLGQITDRSVPLATVQQAFRKAYRESGVTKQVSVHSLRHAYVTRCVSSTPTSLPRSAPRYGKRSSGSCIPSRWEQARTRWPTWPGMCTALRFQSATSCNTTRIALPCAIAKAAPMCRAPCGWSRRSSFAASSSMCCPRGSGKSATSDCITVPSGPCCGLCRRPCPSGRDALCLCRRQS